MKRSRRILTVCHCLLNANAKVFPLATCPGVCMAALAGRIEAGEGLVQLPCPETAFLGMRRFGMTKEQYDQPAYRRLCRELLLPFVDQLAAFASAGYELTGVVGVDGSPSCGVRRTCYGFSGGEVSAPETNLPGQISNLRVAPGKGIFIEELQFLLTKRGLSVPFLSVDEENPAVLLAGNE